MVESHRATDGRTWGQLLESERARRHLLPAAAARAVGVCLDTWNDWVTGKSHPTGYQRNGVYTTFRTMRAFEALLLREHGELKEQERQKPLTFKPFAVVAPPKPLDFTGVPFHRALRSARRHHGLSQVEVASLIDVSDSALSTWEDGSYSPIGKHYAKLLDLFPELATAGRPDVRSGSKPGTPAGTVTPSPDCSLSPDSIAALSPKETPAPMAIIAMSGPAQESFKDGIKFATLLGSLATGRDGARVLEMLQIAKQRGLSIDDVIASMQEAGR